MIKFSHPQQHTTWQNPVLSSFYELQLTIESNLAGTPKPEAKTASQPSNEKTLSTLYLRQHGPQYLANTKQD